MAKSQVLKDNPEYSIYDDGRVYNNYKNKFIHVSPVKSHAGEQRSIAWLSDSNYTNGGHSVSVSRLVAKYFVKNDDPEHKKVVKHINGNTLDNHASNLYWTSNREMKNPILVYDNNTGKFIKEFPSSKALASWLQETKGTGKYTYSSVSYVLNGRRKSYYGYTFKYKFTDQRARKPDKHSRRSTKKSNHCVLMYNATTGKFVKRFPNAYRTANWLIEHKNANAYTYNSVLHCLHKQDCVCYGYVFRYYNQESQEPIPDDIEPKSPVYKYDTNGKFVRVYINIDNASADNDFIAKESIHVALSGKLLKNTNFRTHYCKGYFWFKKQPTKECLAKEITRLNHKYKPIRVYKAETRKFIKEFSQIKEVALWLQQTKGAGKNVLFSVYRCLSNQGQTLYGYTYEYGNQN